MDLRESPYRKKGARHQQDQRLFNTERIARAYEFKGAALDAFLHQSDCFFLHDTISSRVPAARERLGVPTMGGEQCEHCCGAETFKDESIGVGCKNGKDALLLRLPALQELRALQLCYIWHR